MSVNKICIRHVDTAKPGETVEVIVERMHQAPRERWSWSATNLSRSASLPTAIW